MGERGQDVMLLRNHTRQWVRKLDYFQLVTVFSAWTVYPGCGFPVIPSVATGFLADMSLPSPGSTWKTLTFSRSWLSLELNRDSLASLKQTADAIDELRSEHVRLCCTSEFVERLLAPDGGLGL